MYNPIHLFSHHWFRKLLALIFALTVFISVRKTTSYTQVLALPIEAVTLEGEQAFTGFEPSIVNVTFRGSEQAIRRLSFQSSELPQVKVHLEQPPSGETTYSLHLTRKDVSCDSDIRVISIEPNHIVANFDISAQASLPVAEPIITGTPEFGAVKISYHPQEVEIIGSKARLSALKQKGTALTPAILDVSAKTEGFQTTLKILPPDNKGVWVIKPDVIQVDIQFVREESTRVFKDVAVHVLQSETLGTVYKPEPSTVTVTAHGTKRDLMAIEEKSLKVFAAEPPAGLRSEGTPTLSQSFIYIPATNSVDRLTISPTEIILNPIATLKSEGSL